jgi:hypothetical protein
LLKDWLLCYLINNSGLLWSSDVYLSGHNFIIRSQPESLESVARPRILFMRSVVMPSTLNGSFASLSSLKL